MRGMGHTGDQVQGRRTDEFGNLISETGGGFPTDAGGHGGSDTTGAFPADIGATTGHGMTGTHAPDIGAGYAGSGTQGQLHRGSGGVTEKIKEKLPGGHKDEQRTSTTTAGAYEGEHEKKGMMEKIKEKLPGRNN